MPRDMQTIISLFLTRNLNLSLQEMLSDRYPELTSEDGEFIFISSTPTQFEPVKFSTIKKIMEQKPKVVSNSFFKDNEYRKNGYELLKQLDEYVTITQQAKNNHENQQEQIRKAI